MNVVVLLLGLLLVFVNSAQAQQPTKIPRIGFVSAGNLGRPGSRVEAFRKVLHEIGYTDGKNILVEIRYIGMDDQIPGIVAELVEQKVDVLVVRPSHRSARPSRQRKPSPLSYQAVLARADKVIK
jgi:putative tryptophan/tyrosine transport system substrate-binding protein